MLSEGVDLKLFLNHRGNQVRAELSVWHRGQPMVTLQHHDISPDRLAGHIGLVSDFKEENSTRWSAEFAHWELRGDLLAHFPDRTLGPVYFAQHTLDGDQLYLTAQIAPINPDIKTVELYIRTADDDWEKKDEATIHPHARTRSEEHTSELQSRGHLVCRLLLEKKKKVTDMSRSTVDHARV